MGFAVIWHIALQTSSGAMPLAMFFFGPLADAVAIEGILVVTGALLAGVGMVFGRYRYLETRPRAH